MPANVHIFQSEVETKSTYKQKMAKSFIFMALVIRPGMSLIEKSMIIIKIEGADFHIGILHGNESAGDGA